MGTKHIDSNPDWQTPALRKLRHELASCVAIFEASMRNAVGLNCDPDRAVRVHNVGLQKLREIIEEFDVITAEPVDRSEVVAED